MFSTITVCICKTYCQFCKNRNGCIRKFCATEIQVSILAVGSVMRYVTYHFEMCCKSNNS